jgi:hypothetical protein
LKDKSNMYPSQQTGNDNKMIINIPRRAILQQQTHLTSNHQLWKKHVPLGCSVQPQQAKQLTAEATTRLRCSHLSHKVQS